MKVLRTMMLALPIFTAACAGGSGAASLPVAADQFPVMDLHSDILLRAIDHGVEIGDAPTWTQTNTRTWREGNVRDQVLSVWVNSRGVQGAAATRRALQMIDIFEAQAERYAAEFALARTVAESDAIQESGRIAVWLWLEGGAPIDDDLTLLRTFYRLGVRGMTLAWTNNLLWAGSSSDKDDDQMGLTDFGREVVREMNRLGMIVDISHVSERTFFDTLAVTTAPAIASHSGCRALCNHDRNLTDDQLRALAANGGVVGIALLPSFLNEKWDAGWEAAEQTILPQIEELKKKYNDDTRDPNYREERRRLIQAALAPEARVTIDHYVDHIMHAIKVAGPAHVALGSDFDGIWAFPDGIEKASDWPNVAQKLRERGLDDATIRAVFRDNARRVFQQVTGG